MKTLYKSLPADKKPNGFKFKKGVWHKHEGDIKICEQGFHASKNIIDAMNYVNCGYVAKVQVRGKSEKENDKECWSEMKIVEWKKWTKKDSVSLTIYAAELCIDDFEKKYPNDKRPCEAIEAAKKWLKNPTEKNRSAAESAAESAAWSARSATSAATSAERSAAASAESAAESAAWSAASAATSAAWSAAWSAARSAALKKCHNFVIKRKGL